MKPSAHTNASARLRGALGNRQMSMIAIGGVIGAGLFVGSGSAVRQAGPAVLVAYAAIGALAVLVMRMLAEMAVAQPETGSFSSYAGRELGPWAGLSVGWLYAYQWCITVGFEAIAGAAVAHHMLPAIPTWLAALVLMVALIAVNFARVESFGTFEFWFAMIKVAAIIAFLLIGLAAVLGALPNTSAPGTTNLLGHGGFAPNGWLAVLQASLVVFFSYFGTEVVTIAAGEAKDPAQAVRRGINSVVWRILLFYIGSITIVVMLLPWNSTAVTDSPYVAVLSHLGVPFAGTAMNFIVLTAVLSCLNSGIYSSSRMLHSLAERGEAPALFARTTRLGVPAPAVLAASSIGLLTVVANYFLPTTAVYQFLLDSSGAVAVVVYLCITVTHLRGRARLMRERPEALTVRMWAYPWLSLLVLAALLAIIAGMAADSGSRRSLLLTLLVTAVAVVAGLITQRARHPKNAAEPVHSRTLV
ncbi:amino acid permease [Streptomyces camelliae]|uniref:Amino acid permease n=1 Tax=Streptomyces camelliae TaxID=3004093 RepID=A0ABY7NT93_9ACTN|nr:amino acid permease [Streptomyces sp. HUAS 2-6]WBO61449.1 amino acid permease [Streptomyces sp. HUAS 2-6]